MKKEAGGMAGYKVALRALVWLVTGACGVLAATDPIDRPPAVDPDRALRYEDCVRRALCHSPAFMGGQVEIDIRKLDETDERWAFAPTVTLRSRYYVNPPKDSGEPYSLEFSSDLYNPYKTYFSLKARKLITRIAVLAHRQAIADGLCRLGEGFLQLSAMERMAELQKEALVLAERNAAYATNLLSVGGVALEARMAAQEAEILRLSGESLNVDVDRALAAMKSLLGLNGDAPLRLNLEDVKGQVLGGFDPVSAVFSRVETNSLELQIEELREQLLNLNISAAYSEFLPNIHLGVSTRDVLSGSTQDGYFFSIGLDLPIWDGLRRDRNVTRQKLVLKKAQSERGMKSDALKQRLNESVQALRKAESDLKLACGEAIMSSLRKEMGEIGYREGRQTPTMAFSERKWFLEARRNVIQKELVYEMGVLKLRQLCGELNNVYAVSGESDED